RGRALDCRVRQRMLSDPRRRLAGDVAADRHRAVGEQHDDPANRRALAGQYLGLLHGDAGPAIVLRHQRHSSTVTSDGDATRMMKGRNMSERDENSKSDADEIERLISARLATRHDLTKSLIDDLARAGFEIVRKR